MSYDSFRVSTPSFGLSFLLAPFIVRGFLYLKPIGPPCFMHGWGSFAILYYPIGTSILFGALAVAILIS